MSSRRRPETMTPGYARFQRASAPGRKQAGSVRTQEFSEELFMAQMRRPETMKMDFAHG
jgi:hypothetical protein